MVELLLGVGIVAAYVLVGLVLHRHTFKEIEPDRTERALLVFSPVLYVAKRLIERLLGTTAHEHPEDGRIDQG